MPNTIARLKELGFSEYEAKAYAALLQRNPVNGYELAKTSKIPRANVYGVLQKLEERGAIIRLDTEGGVAYKPVPPKELTQRLHRTFSDNLEAARRSLEDIAVPAEHEYIWNMRGYPALLDHARALIHNSTRRLLVAITPKEAQALVGDLQAAGTRRIDITTLCLAGCAEECGNCQGRLFRYSVLPAQRTRWLVLVADGKEVLAGEISGEDALSIRTQQKLLVDLVSWYIRNSIAVSALLNDLGGRVDEMIRPETREILASVGPAGEHTNWLEQMHSLLDRRSE